MDGDVRFRLDFRLGVELINRLKAFQLLSEVDEVAAAQNIDEVRLRLGFIGALVVDLKVEEV